MMKLHRKDCTLRCIYIYIYIYIYGSVSFVGLPDLGPRSSGDLGSIPGYPSQMSAPQAMDMGDPSPGDLSHGDLHWQTQPLETQAPWETRIREAHN